MARGWKRSALLLGGIALLGAVLAATAAAGTRAKTVNVAFIYPKTGGLATFGQEELDGFDAGLAYTAGKCGGYTINPTIIDDATDPATAIAAFKNEVGQGVKIIAGTGSSGIALQLGPLAAQNNVLYISGAAAADADHRAQPEHVPGGPADAAGRPRRRQRLPAQDDGQEGRRLRRGHGVRPGQLRSPSRRSSVRGARR